MVFLAASSHELSLSSFAGGIRRRSRELLTEVDIAERARADFSPEAVPPVRVKRGAL